MLRCIEHLVGSFENGRITRRQLIAQLGALTALAAGGRRADAGTGKSTFEAVGLNHIALNVTDIKRSREFYQKHLGLGIMSEDERSCFMSCGEHFVALFKEEQAGMDHYCYSITEYEAGRAVDTLNAVGLKPRRRSNRVYFEDPDGLTVQVASRP